jgi:hypothetical protein
LNTKETHSIINTQYSKPQTTYICVQVKESDPPLFGERFCFETNALVTNAAATNSTDKGKGTLYVTKQPK